MAINCTLLVTPANMGRIDKAAIDSGIEGFALMQAAGAHVAAVLLARYPGALRAVILCGPGNNGGDDASRAFAACPGPIHRLEDWLPQAGDVIVDALYGAGLDRPVGDDVAPVIERAHKADTPVIAVDLPSGLSGLTGRATGACFQARHTVTFAALKPGHLLMPGRELCGQTHLCDIGIPATIRSGAIIPAFTATSCPKPRRRSTNTAADICACFPGR